jgi:hypothetical protein
LADLDLTKIPRLADGVDLLKGAFSLPEGQVLALVDGVRSAGEIVHLVGEGARQVLLELRRHGKITWFGEQTGRKLPAHPGTPQDAPAPDQPWLTAELDPRELGEEVDLDPDQKRKILWLYQQRKELTHYQVLGIARRSDPKDIKKAYFNVSKEFHPDTFFRKNLGTYKARVEALFKRVTEAYEVLTQAQKRAAYDQTLPYEPTPEELEQKRREELLRSQDERLHAERRERQLRQRRTPRVLRGARIQELYDQAVAEQKKDPSKAVNALHLALSLEPEHAACRALLEEIGPKAARLRAEREFKRGRHEESLGNQEGALQAYLMSLEAAYDEPESLFRAARLMLELERDLKQALIYARRAVELKPDVAEILLVLARLYAQLGMKRNAIREYERYLNLSPLDEAAARRLKELKRSL